MRTVRGHRRQHPRSAAPRSNRCWRLWPRCCSRSAPLPGRPRTMISGPRTWGDCQDLQVRAGNKVAFHAFGEGVQIYRWNGTSWIFVAPQAVLFADAEDDHAVGIHFGGPTWESVTAARWSARSSRPAPRTPTPFPGCCSGGIHRGPRCFRPGDLHPAAEHRGRQRPRRPRRLRGPGGESAVHRRLLLLPGGPLIPCERPWPRWSGRLIPPDRAATKRLRDESRTLSGATVTGLSLATARLARSVQPRQPRARSIIVPAGGRDPYHPIDEIRDRTSPRRGRPYFGGFAPCRSTSSLNCS